MPRARFTVYEDESATPIIPARYFPAGWFVEPILGIPFHIPRRGGPVPAHLDTPGPAGAASSAPSSSEGTVAVALREAAPFWPPWRGQDCVDKGRRDAELRITELRQGEGRGVEEEMWWGEEVLLEMEEDEERARGERKKVGRGKRVWGWVKKRLGLGRK